MEKLKLYVIESIPNAYVTVNNCVVKVDGNKICLPNKISTLEEAKKEGNNKIIKTLNNLIPNVEIQIEHIKLPMDDLYLIQLQSEYKLLSKNALNIMLEKINDINIDINAYVALTTMLTSGVWN